ncbi:MAG: hypothetical protein GXP29_15850 [Planctomycetes bacterium]|nr:hypothetical protein [Planctomycetota bacterium]
MTRSRGSIDCPDNRTLALAERIIQTDLAAPASSDVESERIKQNSERSIFRVVVDDRCVYVKEHIQRSATHRLKWWLLGNPARREHDASRYAIAHGIACAEIFASATVSDPNARARAISLAHNIANAAPLSCVFEQTVRQGTRREQVMLATSVAGLLAKAHASDFLHADDHPGNILVRRRNDAFETFYVDLYGARFSKPVLRADAARSLAAIGQWFKRRASRSLRLAFLKKYIDARGWSSNRAFLRDFVRQVERASLHHAQQLFQKRDRRIGRTNAHHHRIGLADGWRVWLTLRFRPSQEETGAVLPVWPNDNLADHLNTMLGTEVSRQDGERITDGPSGSTQFARTWSQGLAWYLFASPARQRYRMACASMNRDVPTVLPILCAEQRSGASVRCARQIVGRPPQCMGLSELLQKLPATARRHLLEQVGGLLSATFDRGLAIRNISPTRIEVACHKGQDIPMWAGIIGRVNSRPLSAKVRTWMLARFAREAMRGGNFQSSELARVLRACVRRSGNAGRWKQTCVDVLAAME